MNKLTTYVRFATEDDARIIASIHVASWQEIYKNFIPASILNNLSIDERTKKWVDLIKNQVKILIIELDNQMVGFTSIGPSRDIDTDQTICGEIAAIYLHPNYWRKGLGKKLCDHALVELEKMGFSEVILWVLIENMQARKFYESMGFENTGNTKANKYEDKVILNEIRYKKKLIHSPGSRT